MPGPAVAVALLSSFLHRALQRIGQRRPLTVSGLQGGARAWLAAQLAVAMPGPLVVLCESLQRAELLRGDLEFFAQRVPVRLFPQWDTVPYDGFSPGKEVMATRMQALEAVFAGGPLVLVTTPQACMQGMIPPERLNALSFTLERGGAYPRGGLVKRLMEAGYVRVDMVEAPGEFSARGEIVDVFPIQHEHPVRLDFFDDELESMRLFDVSTQESFQTLEQTVVYPASEVVLNEETLAHARSRLPHYKGTVQPEYYNQLYRYLEQGSAFPGSEQLVELFYPRAGWIHEALPENTVWVEEEPSALERTAENYHGEVLGEYELCRIQGSLAPDPSAFYLTPRQWRAARERFYRLGTHGLRLEGGPDVLTAPFADNSELRVVAAQIERLENAGEEGGQRGGKEGIGGPLHASVGQIISRIKVWQANGCPVLLAARSDTGAERLRHLLAEFELGAALHPDETSALAALTALAAPEQRADGQSAPPRDVLLLSRAPHQGFRVLDEAGDTRFALVTEEEMLGEKMSQRRLKKSKLQHFIASLGELKVGQPVVHVEYGIGRYEGLQRLSMGGQQGDFLVLLYAGGDKVYVPVYKFHQVQKYSGVDESAPALHRLGDGAWQRSKQRVSKAIEDMTEELVAVQAARKARTGVAYPRQDALLTEFEEAFPYQETEDQEQAIGEVLTDLSAEQPMDRLVCGDVGFGKTEVAMRAAFLVVLGGRQVMTLVPTTILAQQHYETFTARFAKFPVRIEVLSRFRTAVEQKQVIADFAAGTVDVLIGTHRLLSKDVVPKELGLLVVDEEQRFGVAHKERIKQLKTQVEVLTLSATPIPRTLHMSLMGVRDLSIINTPPMDRVAVRTRLVRSSDYIITEAVEREVRRGGQVFFVHNRVDTIHRIGSYLQSLMPQRRIAVAHGQMSERELEEVMMAFVSGEVEVLLSTSIIESGLDIPRANTIVINNADHFGLSQLYQMRGRVGRSNVQAYAYLLVSPEKVLTELAQKRLTLLQELNDLGSGFKIASHDLEIRGAGNLLGREQSGHVSTVGLELFTQMVEDAVARYKGEETLLHDRPDCRIELGFSYLLPEGYITSTQQRLDVYKQLAELRDEEALWNQRQALEDRFGRPPAELGNLFEMIRIRLLALSLGLEAVERSGGQLQVRFGRPEWIDVEQLMTLVSDPGRGLKIQPGDRVLMGPCPDTPQGVLERLRILEPVVVRSKAA